MAAVVGITVLLLNTSLATSYTPVPTQIPKVCKIQAKSDPLMSAGIYLYAWVNSQYKNLVGKLSSPSGTWLSLSLSLWATI